MLQASSQGHCVVVPLSTNINLTKFAHFAKICHAFRLPRYMSLVSFPCFKLACPPCHHRHQKLISYDVDLVSTGFTHLPSFVKIC